MIMSFSGKVVVVTGAASGVGAAAAEQFAREGARVALVDRDGTKLALVVQRCEALGAKTLAIRADLANEQETTTIVDTTINNYRQLDILVNCAGFLKPGSLLDGNILAAYDAVMRVNLRAIIQLCSLAAPHLIRTKGNIVNISSVASRILPTNPTDASYFISKAALDHFTRLAAKELAPSGVRVNSINPGFIRSDFFLNNDLPITFSEDLINSIPLRQISEPEDIANLILFLASEKARTITGSICVADDGITLK